MTKKTNDDVEAFKKTQQILQEDNLGPELLIKLSCFFSSVLLLFRSNTSWKPKWSMIFRFTVGKGLQGWPVERPMSTGATVPIWNYKAKLRWNRYNEYRRKPGVQSKDVTISSDPAVLARLYIPKAAVGSLQKISVPEDPLPAAYDDSWTALKWVASHSTGNGPEEWLNSHANLKKVFMSGDSAGANIVHNMGIRLGEDKLSGVEFLGIIMVHPYFWGEEPLPLEPAEPEQRSKIRDLWLVAKPTTTGCDDPLMNPATDPRLSSLGVNRVLIFVAEKDILRQRGWYYKEVLSESGWSGVVEVMEAPGRITRFI
ncbi:hypothetical protein NL676_038709 [Syzygium grande]|nr:hypothetical protein NL676_038709 [Syzygium grande]